MTQSKDAITDEQAKDLHAWLYSVPEWGQTMSCCDSYAEAVTREVDELVISRKLDVYMSTVSLIKR